MGPVNFNIPMSTLCAAIVDLLTVGGNIIETGTQSFRLSHAKAQLAAS